MEKARQVAGLSVVVRWVSPPSRARSGLVVGNDGRLWAGRMDRVAEKRRHHDVPRFYLAGFADPGVQPGQSPFVWVRDLATDQIRRRGPHNLATEIGFYGVDTVGGVDYAQMEDELALLESNGARALRGYLDKPVGDRAQIPADLGRLVANLASRTPAFKDFAGGGLADYMRRRALGEVAEPDVAGDASNHVAVNHRTGARIEGPLSTILALLRTGEWEYRLSGLHWTDLLRLQTWYFENELFPLLRWTLLTAPPGFGFVTSDRPVVITWDGGWLAERPSTLRHPSSELSVPLSARHALIGTAIAPAPGTRINADDINSRTYGGAKRFIAASSRQLLVNLD